MTAKGGLFEKARHEAVVLDDINIFLLERALAPAKFLRERSGGIAGSEGVLARVVRLLVRHGNALATDLVSQKRVSLGRDD